MTAAEILLAVIRPGTCRGLANGAAVIRQQLRALSGPAAFRTFHAIVDPSQELIERNFKRNSGGEDLSVFRQPLIKKNRLRQAAGKPVEHPATGLLG